MFYNRLYNIGITKISETYEKIVAFLSYKNLKNLSHLKIEQPSLVKTN